MRPVSGAAAAGFRSAQITLLLTVTAVIEPAAVEVAARRPRDLAFESVKNSLVITPKFSGLDCNFDAECLWTWDADNFTEAAAGSSVLPGQVSIL
jgi:hypothetical protein